MARKPKHVHEDDDVDGCACDVELKRGEETKDADLPEAAGGIEMSLASDDIELDGCDLDFTRGSKTNDAELPESMGGVE